MIPLSELSIILFYTLIRKAIVVMEVEFKLSSILPEAIGTMLDEMPESLKDCSEEELIEQANPNENLWHLRRNFWAEFRSKVENGKPKQMYMTNVYNGVIGDTQFYRICRKFSKVAFITRPLQSYDDVVDLTAEIGFNRVKEIIHKMSVMKTDPDTGKTDYDLQKVDRLFKMVQWTTDRAKGQAIQRQQIQQHNINETKDKALEIAGDIDDPRLLDIPEKKEPEGMFDAELIE